LNIDFKEKIIEISVLLILSLSLLVFFLQLISSQRDYNLTTRPWLGPAEPSANIDFNPKELTISLMVKNYGKLPALNVLMDKFMWVNGEEGMDPVKDDFYGAIFPNGLVITEFPPISSKDINPDTKIEFLQVIRYEDPRGKKYITKYTTSLMHKSVNRYLKFIEMYEAKDAGLSNYIKWMKKKLPIKIKQPIEIK